MADEPKKTQEAQHLKDDNFHATIDESKIPVFVDFYADWCGPCQMAAPVVNKLVGEYAGKVLVVKVNVDESSKIASEYGVMSIPTVITFKADKDGKMAEVDRKTGFPGEDGYKQMLDELLK